MRNITVIVPTGKNHKVYALESLNRQKEIINFIIERGPNPSKNRNSGVKKSKTKLIAFINSHTILKDNWARMVNEFFSKYPEIDIVGGTQLTPKNDPSFAKISGYALSSIFGAGEVSRRYKINKLSLNANEKYLTSSNLICKREVFNKVLFDEDIYPGEDPKFISDAKKEGFKVAYSPDIIAYNKRRDSIKGLAKQIFNYGFMRAKKEKFVETLKNPLFLVPSSFFIYLFFIPTLIFINKLFLIPIIFYLMLNISFSFYESIRNKSFISLFILPFLFFVIHISYGTGFILSSIQKVFK